MFKGRALLVIDRLETTNPNDFHWDIYPYIQRLNHDDPGDEVNEAFNCMKYDCIPAPDAAYKMTVGDRIYVLVHFEIHFTHDDYTGEHDFDMYLERQRVLKRQLYTEKKFRKKFYKLWKTSQPEV
jgi:hypothetical protein